MEKNIFFLFLSVCLSLLIPILMLTQKPKIVESFIQIQNVCIFKLKIYLGFEFSSIRIFKQKKKEENKKKNIESWRERFLEGCNFSYKFVTYQLEPFADKKSAKSPKFAENVLSLKIKYFSQSYFLYQRDDVQLKDKIPSVS